ncbi:hypothetical protein HK104_007491, partial [Borealophlyctis nickersoniae]
AIFNAYNHEVHSVTKCLPYEVFFGRTNVNWARTECTRVMQDHWFTDAEKESMYQKNLDGMRKQAAKEFARWYKKHETLLAANDKANPLTRGSIVMVMHWNKKLHKKLRSPWVAVAEIENWKTDNHGANQRYTRRLLALPKEGMDVDDLEDMLEVAKHHIFDVECLLAKQFLQAERKWEVLVQWRGYSFETVSWEPKEHLAYDVDSVWQELPEYGENDDVSEILAE